MELLLAAQERQLLEELRKGLLGHRRHANGRCGTVVRSVGLADRAVGNTGGQELELDLKKGRFVGNGKNESVGALVKVAG